MTRKEAESYTDNFPPLKAELERELRKTLPIKYLIIDNDGTAYCTACEEKLYPGEYDSSIKHRQTTVCSHCGETVTAIYNYHNFHGSVVECKSNVGVFLSDGKTDNLYIRFYTVTLLFNAREIMPHIAINEVQRYLFTANQAFRYKTQYIQLTEEIQSVRKAKTDLLDGADLPLEGLSVDNGELTYNGFKWDNMSGSEQLKVATAIVRKLNPNCGFVLIDKLEQMDTDTLNDFGRWLESEGLQAIATRVSTGDECSIIIEDGYSKPVEKKETTTWKAGTF